MSYEVWNTGSGNLIAAFESEVEAVAFAEASMREHGAAYLEQLALVQEDRDGRLEMVAEGSALLACAVARRDAVLSGAGSPTGATSA